MNTRIHPTTISHGISSEALLKHRQEGYVQGYKEAREACIKELEYQLSRADLSYDKKDKLNAHECFDMGWVHALDASIKAIRNKV